MRMYYQTVDKIKFQLQEQGFTNILDLSHDGNKPSFMEDTIHIGWAGWVKVDQVVNQFVSNKQSQPHYQINDKFLSKLWANLVPTVNNLAQSKTELR